MKGKLKVNHKGMSALAMAVAIVLVSTSLIIGVWIMSTMQGVVTLPTTTVVENLTLVNNTAKAITHPYLNSLTSVVNSTGKSHPLSGGAAYCTPASSTITCIYNVTHPADTNPSIVTYTYNPQAANNTLSNIFATTWSSFQLGVVVLIVIAAVAIIGILVVGFGKAGGPA